MESLLGGAVIRHRSGRLVALGSTAVLATAGAGPLVMLTSSTASANAALVVSTLADSGVGSLRQAMVDANSAAGVDTITFTAGLTGTIDVLSDLPALDEGIDLQGPGASVITIDGGWTAAGGAATGHSLFVLGDIDVTEGASTISGVTITGGNGSGNTAFGAIAKLYGDADLTITDVVLTGNFAGDHGGAVQLYNTDGTVAIRDSVISNNVANSKGGAIYSDGRDALFLTLTNVEITGNTAGDEGGGLYLSATDTTINNSTITANTSFEEGGGIGFENGSMTIVDSTISENSSTSGGGLYGYNGSLTISNSTITANTASGDGGGINFEDGPFAVVDSTITGNTAGGKGGGIWIDDSLASISDTTIDGNVSGSSGGGIYLYETSMTISNSTLSGNSATNGGALYIAADDNDDYGSATFIENSTISGNHATQDGGAISIFMDDTDEVEVLLEIVQSTITDNSTDGLEENVGGIVLQDNTEATITGSIVAGNLGNDIGLYSTSLPSVTASDSVLGVIQTGVTLVDDGGTQVGVTDPMLGLLANNGGVTKTHALLAGSPAIDAGPNPVPVFDGNEFDQRGVGFARIVFGVADVGAFEVQEPPATEPVVPAFTG